MQVVAAAVANPRLLVLLVEQAVLEEAEVTSVTTRNNTLTCH